MPWSSRIGAWSARAPRWTLIIAAIALITSIAVALPQLNRLSGAITTDPATESAQAAAAVRQATGQSAEPAFFAIVKVDEADKLDAKVDDVRKILKQEANVVRIDAPNAADPKSMVLRSEDGKRAFISVTLGTPQGDGRTDATMRRLIDQLENQPGVELGGAELVTHEVTTTIAEDLHKAELIIIPILLLLALWFFRSVAAALVPVVIAGLATLLTMLALVITTYFTPVSNFALNLTTALAMGLGIDYGLLLVSRFREQLAAGDDTKQAVARTMATAGHAVMFSALTVAASMASLLIFPQSYIQSIGIAGVLVAIVSGLTALIVVPALLTVLGPNIDAISPKWMQRRATAPRALEDGAWYRLTMKVSRHAGIVMVLSTLFVIFLALPARHATFTLADETVLPKDSAARQAIAQAGIHFPKLSAPTATVVVPKPPADTTPVAMTKEIQGIVGDRGSVRPTAVTPKLWLFTVDLQERAVTDQSLDVVRDLRSELPPQALVQGLGAQLLDARASIWAHAPYALGIVVAATMFFILVLTGSVVLAIKTVIMNALTISAMFGVLVWIFQEGHGERLLGFTSQGGLEVGQPMIVFALVFGLSTDYGVFLLARVKESYDAGYDTTTALAIGTERTGRVITTAALLFCVAMGVSALSRLVTVKQVGFGVAFAVLLDATLVRGVLVPATMQVLGKWNWWAPGPLKRLANHSTEH